MNHIIALILTISAFASGLFVIYKFIRVKYVSYDTRPIHYWLDKPTKIKKRYKTFKAIKRKKFTKISSLNNRNKSQLSYAKYSKLNRHSANIN